MATLGAETHAPSLRPRARGAAEAQAGGAPRLGKGGRGAEAASPPKRASKRAPWNGDAAGTTDDGAPPPKLLDAPGSPVGKRVHEALGETRNPVVLMGYANGSAKAWVATLRGDDKEDGLGAGHMHAGTHARPRGPSLQAWDALPYTKPAHYDSYEAILERREWINPYPVGSARWRVAEEKRRAACCAQKTENAFAAAAAVLPAPKGGSKAASPRKAGKRTTLARPKSAAAAKSASRAASARALELRREQRRVRDEHAAVEVEIRKVTGARVEVTRHLEAASARWLRAREDRDRFDADKAEQVRRHKAFREERERIAIESSALDADLRDLEAERDALHRTRVTLEAARLALSDARIELRLRADPL